MKRPDILRNQKDFTLIYKKGKSSGSRYVVVLYRQNGLTCNRLAFLASKKVGNSVRRNRARRLMKESFRLFSEIIPIGYDIIFIARNTINDRKCADVKESIETALKRAGLIKR